jgi:hypothetical protein
MTMDGRDRTMIRELAREVAEIAALPEQAEKARLWTACNDLRPVRPMVFLDPQNGWPELEKAWLDLHCQDPALRGVERSLRLRLLRARHMPDDMPVTARFEVPLVVRGSGYDDYGIPIELERSGGQGGAYHIVRLVNDEQDLRRLHPRPIAVDHDATNRAEDIANDLLGDILTVVKRGKTLWRYGLSRVLVHWRGLDQMMLDMYDHPALLHRLMALLRDDFLSEIQTMEEAGAVSLNTTETDVNGSGGLAPTTDLPGPAYDGVPRVQNCVCWGESQETVGVGPAQFEEFVLNYQLPLLRCFGLVDYGCCEPLDGKLDLIMARVANLRWVAVSPWANRELCAEKICGRYVYVYKPNPSYLCSPTPAWDQAEEDIRHTLRVTRGQPVHIVMKDTSTFHDDASRVTRWCEMARRIAVESA